MFGTVPKPPVLKPVYLIDLSKNPLGSFTGLSKHANF
jgi:hypothetical protein